MGRDEERLLFSVRLLFPLAVLQTVSPPVANGSRSFYLENTC